MKLKELKHNHSLTDLLKVLIFSILMITPLLSVATRCLYVICNKNAYQSAEITQTTYNASYKYQTNEVNSFNDLRENNYYCLTLNDLINANDDHFTLENDTGNDTVQFLPVEQPEFLYSKDSFNADYMGWTYNTEQHKIELEFDDENDELNFFIYYATDLFIDRYVCFKILDLSNIDDNFNYKKLPDEFNELLANETQSTTLDNVFEYSVNKLAESPILSWTQQTAIYTGVNTMTTQLGVSTPTIAMLIVYWFLLTVIYIIIDIIIKLFTWLTHMIGSKSV